jgi:hypothetical protein
MPGSPASARLGPLLVAAPVGVALVWLLFGGKETRFEDFALGVANTSVFAAFEGSRIHCEYPEDAEACLAPARTRDLPHQVLWLGNSQLNAINQYQPGERPAPILLAEALRPESVEVLTFSQPNASLQEHYVMFEYVMAHYDDRLDWLLLGLVFDDTRETGLRAAIAEALEAPDLAARLATTETGRRLLKAAAPDDNVAAGGAATLAMASENALSAFLDKHAGAWAAREEARGRMEIRLHELRNTVFGIQPTSKRSILPAAYATNLQALRDLLARARDLGVRVLTYVVPLRSDVEPPYIAAEYATFKRDVAEISAHYGADRIDLEDLVPAEHWGTKPPTVLGGGEELDFMHFQSPGHGLLSEAIEDALRQRLP